MVSSHGYMCIYSWRERCICLWFVYMHVYMHVYMYVYILSPPFVSNEGKEKKKEGEKQKKKREKRRNACLSYHLFSQLI